MKTYKELKFTFINSGTPYEFKALKEVYDPTTKTRRSQLDIHRDLVKSANSPLVYILDHTGKVLDV